MLLHVKSSVHVYIKCDTIVPHGGHHLVRYAPDDSKKITNENKDGYVFLSCLFINLKGMVCLAVIGPAS